jgi:hypothetical protein
MPRAAAQALATSESGDELPGIVAHPPLAMKSPCCQELIFLSSTSCSVALFCCWNLTTQIGERAATRAVFERALASRSAMLCVTQPPQVNR